MAKRKCKRCGRQFDSKGPGDYFCSPLCKMTGFFMGGGGDTSKPGVAKPAEVIPAPKPVRIKKDDEKYARVRKMFTLPAKERWELAKTFSEEERAYARRLAKRSLMEEDRLTREWDWNNGSSEETEEDVIYDSGLLGESDDGSI
mgnify:CR=1 FL=1